MPDEGKAPGVMLLAVDSSEDSIKAAGYGVELAKRLGLRPKLVHVAVYSEQDRIKMKATSSGEFELGMLDCEGVLDGTREALGLNELEGTVRVGEVGREFAAISGPETGVEMIVVGRRRLGMIARLILGRVSEQIIHAVRVPVLIYPPEYQGQSDPNCWVLPTELSDVSRQAYPLAVRLGAEQNSRVLLVHAAKTVTDELRAKIDAEAETLKAKGLNVEVVVEAGAPKEVIKKVVKEQGGTGLIIATHGRTGLDKLLSGSVTEGLLRSTNCPVVVLRPEKD